MGLHIQIANTVLYYRIQEYAVNNFQLSNITTNGPIFSYMKWKNIIQHLPLENLCPVRHSLHIFTIVALEGWCCLIESPTAIIRTRTAAGKIIICQKAPNYTRCSHSNNHECNSYSFTLIKLFISSKTWFMIIIIVRHMVYTMHYKL